MMRFSLHTFRKSAPRIALSVMYCFGICFSAHLQGADTTPVANGPAEALKSEKRAELDGRLDFSPDSNRRINFPDHRSSIENLFDQTRPQPIPMPPPAHLPDQRTRRLLDDQNNW